MSQKIKCPYCDKKAELVTGKEIYPHRFDLYGKFFWLCRDCDAYVGCHPVSRQNKCSSNPLGRLANAELRKSKIKAHSAFDPIWRCGEKSRSEAYKWLAESLGVSRQNCHIGMFDVDMCNRVVEVCNAP